MIDSPFVHHPEGRSCFNFVEFLFPITLLRGQGASGAPPGSAAFNLAEVAAEEVTLLLNMLGPKRVHVMGRVLHSSLVQLRFSWFPPRHHLSLKPLKGAEA